MTTNNIFEDEKFKNFINQHGKQIKGMAKNVKPETLTDEKQLKETLKMLAKMANIPADEQKLDKIVGVLQKENFNPNDPDAVSKLLKNMKPKK